MIAFAKTKPAQPAQSGFWHLMVVAVLGAFCLHPVLFLSHLARASGDIQGALSALAGLVLNHAWPRILVLFIVAWALHFALRKRDASEDPIDYSLILAKASPWHLAATAIFAAWHWQTHPGAPHLHAYPADIAGGLGMLAWVFGRLWPNHPWVQTLCTPFKTLPKIIRQNSFVGPIALGMALLAYPLAERWQSIAPILPGDAAPTISAPHIAGPKPNQHPPPRLTLIDFWATWCGPCIEALPHLTKLHKTLGPKGLAIVSVNIEVGAEAAVRTFVAKRSWPYPVLFDRNGLWAKQFGVSNLPTAVVVDSHGDVVFIQQGRIHSQGFKNKLLDLLQTTP